MFSSMQLGRTSRAMVLGGLVALTASVVMAGGVSAKPLGAGPGPPSGNKSGAKACKDGGFNNVVRQDNTGFASEEECVAYAAQGGVLQPKPPPPPPTPYEQWETACQSYTPPGHSLDQVVSWSCGWLGLPDGPPVVIPTTTFTELQAPCTAANGTLSIEDARNTAANDYVVYCDFPS